MMHTDARRAVASRHDGWAVIALAALLSLLAFCSGCSASQEYPAIPPGLDRSGVPVDTIRMTAEHFKFTPDVIRVKAGTIVHVEIRSLDGTHGFAVGTFGIDEEIDEGVTKTVEFYVPARGEYGFKCSHFCGLGHLGMNGTIVVE